MADTRVSADEVVAQYLQSQDSAAPAPAAELLDADQVVAQYLQSRPPEAAPAGPREWSPVEGSWELAKAGARGLAVQAPAKLIDAAQHYFGEQGNNDPFERFSNWASESSKASVEEGRKAGLENKTLDPFGLVDLLDVREFEENLGFSASAVPTAAATGGVGALVGGGLGALVGGPPGAVIGAKLGGVLGGMAGGAATMWGTTKYQVQKDFVDTWGENFQKDHGRAPLKAEQQQALAEFQMAADKYSLFEVGPEMVGTVLELALMATPATRLLGKTAVKAIYNKLGKGFVGRAGVTATGVGAKVGAAIPIEEGTETVTQIGQSQSLEGTILQDREVPLSFAKPEDWMTAAKEVLPQTLLLSGFMGGVSGGVETAYHGYTRAKAREVEAKINELQPRVFNEDGTFRQISVTDPETGAVTTKDNLAARREYFDAIHELIQTDPLMYSDAIEGRQGVQAAERIAKLRGREERLAKQINDPDLMGRLGDKAKQTLRAEHLSVSNSLVDLYGKILTDTKALDLKSTAEEIKAYRDSSRLTGAQEFGLESKELDALTDNEIDSLLTDGLLTKEGQPAKGFAATKFGSPSGTFILPAAKAQRYDELRQAAKDGTILSKTENAELAGLQKQGVQNQQLAEETQLVNKHLNAAVGAQTGESVKTGSYRAAVAPNAQIKLIADALGKAFGKRVVFYRPTEASPMNINGNAPSTATDVIFVNPDILGETDPTIPRGNQPFGVGVNFLIGHEMSHQLEREGGTIYQDLVSYAKANATTRAKQWYQKAMDEAQSEEKGTAVTTTMEQIQQELLADFVGHRFNDPALIEKLVQQKPETAAKFSAFLKAFLAKTATNMLGYTKLQPETLFNNYTIMAATTDAKLQQYTKNVAAGVRDTTMFAPGKDPANQEASAAGTFSRGDETDNLIELVTKPVRDFHKNFMADVRKAADDLRAKVAEHVEQGYFKWPLGSRVRSDRTGVTYEITGYMWHTKKDVGQYVYRIVGVTPEAAEWHAVGDKGLLYSKMSEELPDFQLLTGPQGVAGTFSRTINVDGIERSTTNADGRPIHPTEDGIRNFWKWFGDSKVVDAEGRPLVVYHGTPEGEFPAFTKRSKGDHLLGGTQKRPGISFHYSRDLADVYANEKDPMSDGVGASPHVFEVYIKAEKPWDYDNKAHLRVAQSALENHPKYEGWMAAELKKGDWEAVEAKPVQQAMRDAGFDSYFSNDNPGKAINIFSPTQIKSATGNTGAFDGTKDNITFNRAQPFFSKLQEIAEQKVQGKTSLLNLKAMLKNAGVSPVEIDNVLTGLDEKVLAKQEILDHVKANTTAFEDVVLGEKKPKPRLNIRKLSEVEDLPQWVRDRGYPDDFYWVIPERGEPSVFPTEQEAVQALGTYRDEDADTDGFQPTQFSDPKWQLPGANEGSYREMFVTAPVDHDAHWESEKYRAARAESRRLLNEYNHAGVTGDPATQAEIEPKLAAARVKESSMALPAWQDGHSQYSSVKNPIVRIRYNVRGNTLFIEEMQGPSDANQQKMPEWLRKRIYDIGIKRVIALAKEQGYDGVAWTTGEQQADRYDLSKQVDKIEYWSQPDHASASGKESKYVGVDMGANGTQGFEVDPVTGKVLWAYGQSSLVGKSLEDVVGKEIAKKILEGPAKGEISEDGLKVGGEGLKNLYDTMLPRLFAKYGKEKVGVLGLRTNKAKAVDGEDYVRLKELIKANDYLGFDTVREAVSGLVQGSAAQWEWNSKEEQIEVQAILDRALAQIQPFLPVTPNTPGAFSTFARGLTDQDLIDLKILRAAVKFNGQTHISKAGKAHWNALYQIPEVYNARTPADKEKVIDSIFKELTDGFVTPTGEFLSREQAAQWVKTNDPETYRFLHKQFFSLFPGEPRLESMGYFDAMGIYDAETLENFSRELSHLSPEATPQISVDGKTVTYSAQIWTPVTRRVVMDDIVNRRQAGAVVLEQVSAPNPMSGLQLVLASASGSRMEALAGDLGIKFQKAQAKAPLDMPGTFSRSGFTGVAKNVGDVVKKGWASAASAAGEMHNAKDFANYAEKQWLSKLDWFLKALPFSSKIDIYKDLFAADPKASRQDNMLERLYRQIKEASYQQNRWPGEADAKYNEALGLAGGKTAKAWQDFNDLILTSTFYGMDPSITELNKTAWETDAEWAAHHMEKKTQRTRQQAFDDVQAIWKLVGKTPGLQAKYHEVINHMKGVRAETLSALIARVANSGRLSDEQKKTAILRLKENFGNVRGPYAPLVRFGKWVAVVKEKDTDTLDMFSKFESLAELEAFVAEKKAEGFSVLAYVEGEAHGPSSGLDVALLDQINQLVEITVASQVHLEPEVGANAAEIAARNLERKAEASKLSNLIAQQMHFMAMKASPENSALKHMLQRKGVRGYNDDGMRGYVDYMMKQGRLLAGLKYNDMIDSSLKEISNRAKEYVDDAKDSTDIAVQRRGIEATMVANDIERHVWAFRNERTSGLARNLGKASLVWYLSSPSQYLINFSQVFVVGMPYLGSRYGFGKASAALGKAMNRLTGAEKAEYTVAKIAELEEKIKLSGVDATLSYDDYTKDPTQWGSKRVGDYRLNPKEREDFFSGKAPLNTVKLTEMDQRRLVLLRASQHGTLDLTLSHDALDVSMGNDKTGVLYTLSWAMRVSEMHSRKIMLLSAYELSREGNNFSKAYDAAEEATLKTLFDYSKENRPELLAGSTMRVLTQFQTFRINMLYRLSRNFYLTFKGASAKDRREAKKELAGVMGMVMILGGVFGLPLLKTMFSVLNLAFGDDDDPFDSKMAFEQWLTENFGTTVARMITNGLPTVFGWNISRRVGMESIYPFESMAMDVPEWMGPTSKAHWILSQFGGPSYGIVADVIAGQDLLRRGEWLDGMIKMTPKPVKDGLRSYQLATEGLKDSKGRRLMADGEIGVYDLLSMAVGINPDGISQALDANRKMNLISTRLSNRRGEIMNNFNEAVLKGNTDGKLDAIEEMRAFNTANPLFAITTTDLRGGLKRDLYADQAILEKRQMLIASKYGLPIYRKGEVR